MSRKNVMQIQENLDPIPKSPIIANFFAQMGRSEELGSGMRNLYKRSLLYAGRLPKTLGSGTLNTEAVKKRLLQPYPTLRSKCS